MERLQEDASELVSGARQPGYLKEDDYCACGHAERLLLRAQFRDEKASKADYKQNEFTGTELPEQTQGRSKGCKPFRIRTPRSSEVGTVRARIRSQGTAKARKQRAEEVGVGATTLRSCSRLQSPHEKKTALAGVAQWIELQACEPKGHWFASQSGHMPGLRARYPGGSILEATTH